MTMFNQLDLELDDERTAIGCAVWDMEAYWNRMKAEDRPTVATV